ncbi:unnamed protein product [Amoebophrya sp. A120]|nr:unnamed protein product [Amoebophrya sp. A120]|eukprot:GSA120T00024388001.1
MYDRSRLSFVMLHRRKYDSREKRTSFSTIRSLRVSALLAQASAAGNTHYQHQSATATTCIGNQRIRGNYLSSHSVLRKREEDDFTKITCPRKSSVFGSVKSPILLMSWIQIVQELIMIIGLQNR